MNYHITIVEPQSYTHSAALADVVQLLHLSFRDLGIPCSSGVNILKRDRHNILLGYHLVSDPGQLNGYTFTAYQFEQLSDSSPWWTSAAKQVLEMADAVWDYSPKNIAFLRKHGIEAQLLLLGHNEGLRKISPWGQPNIDVLLYGSINKRRQDVIEELCKRGHRAEALFNVYGAERDRYIARSKIILNIHFYVKTGLMEQVRLSYLINNAAFIVTESSPDNPYRTFPPKAQVISAPYERLVDECEYYLTHPDKRIPAYPFMPTMASRLLEVIEV